MPRDQQPAPVPDGSGGGEQNGAEALLRAQAAELAALRALVQELPADLEQLQQDAQQWRQLAPQLPALKQQLEGALEQERQQLEQQRAGVQAERLEFLFERAALGAGVKPEYVDLVRDQLGGAVTMANGVVSVTIGEETMPAAVALAGLLDRPEPQFRRLEFAYQPRYGAGSGGAGARSSGSRINPGSADWMQLSPAQKLQAAFGTIPGRNQR